MHITSAQTHATIQQNIATTVDNSHSAQNQKPSMSVIAIFRQVGHVR
jgi:hypothetical protein